MNVPHALVVNVTGGYAVLDTGETINLTNYLDDDGEETSDLYAAVSVVGPLADGRWIAINLSAMEQVKPN